MAVNKTDILFLSHRYDIVSGGEKALLDMVKYTVSIGLKPHVIIGSKGNITRYLNDMKVPYTEIFLPFWAHSGDDPSAFHFTSLNPTVNTTLQIVNLIQTLKPRLCVTNTIVVPWLAYASSLTKTPHAWFIHELGTAGFNFRYAIGETETLRTVDLLSDAIFYNSQTTADYYLPHFSNNTQARIVYPIGNPERPEKIKSPFSPGVFALVIIGQVKPQKGQFDAVKAVTLLRKKGVSIQLGIIGGTEDRAYEKQIRNYITENKMDESILFMGQKNNPSSYLALADACLVCATNESFGRVAVESMVVGTPVIGASSAGTAEIINSNAIGRLYKPHDIHDLMEKIEELQKDKDLASSIAQRAQREATKRYNQTEQYRSFIDYFNSLDGSKTALDLSPLASSFSDFTATVELLESKNKRLEAIENSKQWKIMSSIKRRVIRKKS